MEYSLGEKMAFRKKVILIKLDWIFEYLYFYEVELHLRNGWDNKDLQYEAVNKLDVCLICIHGLILWFVICT